MGLWIWLYEATRGLVGAPLSPWNLAGGGTSYPSGFSARRLLRGCHRLPDEASMGSAIQMSTWLMHWQLRESTGVQQSQRSSTIGIEPLMPDVPAEAGGRLIDDPYVDRACWRKMSIENFRGFRERADFDLAAIAVLVHGPGHRLVVVMRGRLRSD